MTWGGYEVRDIDILEDAGLTYESFKCVIDGESQDFYHFRNWRWKPCVRHAPYEGLLEYMNNNEDFMHELINEVAQILPPQPIIFYI